MVHKCLEFISIKGGSHYKIECPQPCILFNSTFWKWNAWLIIARLTPRGGLSHCVQCEQCSFESAGVLTWSLSWQVNPAKLLIKTKNSMLHKHRLHSGIFNISKKHFLQGAKEEIFLENNTGSVFLGFGILCSI